MMGSLLPASGPGARQARRTRKPPQSPGNWGTRSIASCDPRQVTQQLLTYPDRCFCASCFPKLWSAELVDAGILTVNAIRGVRGVGFTELVIQFLRAVRRRG